MKRSNLARDLSHDLVSVSRSAVTALIAPCARSTGPLHLGARYTQDVADGFHRSSRAIRVSAQTIFALALPPSLPSESPLRGSSYRAAAAVHESVVAPLPVASRA